MAIGRSLRAIRADPRAPRRAPGGSTYHATVGRDLPRLTVALTFDHDSLSDGIRRGDSPVKLSHAEFGHRS
jgi:hypothetical protein